MSGWLTRANARKLLTYRPAPKPLVALYLALRWRAIVSPSADITYPGRLRLGRGVRLGRCRIHCSGPVTLGDGAFVHDGAILNASHGEIVIGERVEVNPYCVLYGMGGLHIGRDTGVAAHTVMVTANHGIEDLDVPMMRQPSRKEGVSVAENVWIGAGCVILDGVSVGAGAVVAAGAVVTRDVGREDVVGGVPARVIKNRRREAAIRSTAAGDKAIKIGSMI